MSYKAALIALMLIAGVAVAVTAVPEASAHNCTSISPSACGDCTSGVHNHGIWCSSSGNLVLA
jgi:hypothetical protein